MSPDQKAEAAMLARLRAGDQAAWAALVRREAPMLRVTAERYLHDWHEAEEIAMRAFAAAHRCLPTFRGTCKLRTWLVTIAANLAKNRYHWHRRRQRAAHIHLDAPVGEMAGTLAEVIPDEAPDAVELNDLRAEISRGLVVMRPLDRRLIEMVASGTSYNEIRTALGCNLGTVKSRVARARDRLREQLALAS